MTKEMTYFSISSQELTKEAENIWFEVEILIPEKNFFIIKWNWKEILFKSTDFGWNTSLASKIADDKILTYTILDKYWYPIPQTFIIKNIEEIDSYKEKISFPVIVKPHDQSHRNGVKMNIKNIEQLKRELKDSFQKYDTMIIQEQIEWDEVRVLVVEWNIILAINRIPPFVIWDWKNTILELINQENKNNTLRWEWYENPLSYIKVDEEVYKTISQRYWYTLESIPSKWQKVFLRTNSNIWTWWIAKEVTNILHPEIKQMCLEITEKLWFGLCWIDLLIKDFSKPIKNNVKILELNATPGIWWDKELTSINTAKKMLEILFWMDN